MLALASTVLLTLAGHRLAARVIQHPGALVPAEVMQDLLA